MRRSRGASGGEDEAQNYLVTVSDLMAGLVFLFIITLMIFVLRYQTATASIQSADRTRQHLLETLRDSLRQRGLRVQVDAANGILRLTERSINFPSGSADPVAGHEVRIQVLAEVMEAVVPCFVPDRSRCSRPPSEGYSATINALLIEGHTDVDRLNPAHRLRDNLELSGARAARVHRTLIQTAPFLDSLSNQEGVRILSISGYGDQRLLNRTDPLAEENRRIDLRFIMDPPRPEGTVEEPLPAREIREGYRQDGDS